MWTDNTRSEQIGDLIAALAKAQSDIKAPIRNREVSVTPKSGGQGYKFKYATLDAIIETVREPLSKNGLWFTQTITKGEDHYVLLTRLFHSTGQFISSETPLIVDGNGNQAFGSSLTYMRRYALSALLGVAADEDDDGNAADGNQVDAMKDRKPAPPAPDVMVPPKAGPKKALKPEPIIPDPELNDDISDVGGPDISMPVAFIPVTFLDAPENNHPDWLTWGKQYAAAVRACTTQEQIDALEKGNDMPLKNLERDSKKMFANLMVAVSGARNDLRK